MEVERYEKSVGCLLEHNLVRMFVRMPFAECRHKPALHVRRGTVLVTDELCRTRFVFIYVITCIYQSNRWIYIVKQCIGLTCIVCMMELNLHLDDSAKDVDIGTVNFDMALASISTIVERQQSNQSIIATNI